MKGRQGAGGITSVPCHPTTDEWCGQLSHTYAFRPAQPHPCNQSQIYCGGWAMCRASFRSAASGEKSFPELQSQCGAGPVLHTLCIHVIPSSCLNQGNPLCSSVVIGDTNTCCCITTQVRALKTSSGWDLTLDSGGRWVLTTGYSSPSSSLQFHVFIKRKLLHFTLSFSLQSVHHMLTHCASSFCRLDTWLMDSWVTF